jgi:hypothetical protein
MVYQAAVSPARLNRTFAALAEPARRAILEHRPSRRIPGVGLMDLAPFAHYIKADDLLWR